MTNLNINNYLGKLDGQQLSANDWNGALGAIQGKVNEVMAAVEGVLQLQDDAITTDKIADSAVTVAKIANGAVTGSKIANGTITRDKLAFNTSEDDSITTEKISSEGLDGIVIQENTLPPSSIKKIVIDLTDQQIDNTPIIEVESGSVTYINLAAAQWFNNNVDVVLMTDFIEAFNNDTAGITLSFKKEDTATDTTFTYSVDAIRSNVRIGTADSIYSPGGQIISLAPKQLVSVYALAYDKIVQISFGIEGSSSNMSVTEVNIKVTSLYLSSSSNQNSGSGSSESNPSSQIVYANVSDKLLQGGSFTVLMGIDDEAYVWMLKDIANLSTYTNMTTLLVYNSQYTDSYTTESGYLYIWNGSSSEAIAGSALSESDIYQSGTFSNGKAITLPYDFTPAEKNALLAGENIMAYLVIPRSANTTVQYAAVGTATSAS